MKTICFILLALMAISCNEELEVIHTFKEKTECDALSSNIKMHENYITIAKLELDDYIYKGVLLECPESDTLIKEIAYHLDQIDSLENEMEVRNCNRKYRLN